MACKAGRHDPHVAPARVALPTASTVAAPDAMAAAIVFVVTLAHAQMIGLVST
jgi:hypothetical protein